MPRLRFGRAGFIFLGLMMLGCSVLSPGRELMGLPVNHKVIIGESLSSSLGLPQSIHNNIVFRTNRPEFLRLDGKGRPIVADVGRFDASVRLFNIIPLRYMTVTSVPHIEVVPGGQAIGILVHAQGVMVVGQAAVTGDNGKEMMPARDAGIKTGDVILKINGRQVTSETDVRQLVDQAGKEGRSLNIEYKRRKRICSTRLNPVYCGETGSYRIGLLVHDSTAGVGTLTFYDPKTRSYGALGHVIADARTAQAVELEEGKIVEALIEDIKPGRRGRPGEKVGVFAGNGGVSGTINKNSPHGIFGVLLSPPRAGYYQKTLPVALLSDVRCGPAKMLTVLDGQKVESFDIEIERIRHEGQRDGRGLLLRITDGALLKRSGGIVQGMSGSPIVQDGKFVGAVTHVFINNPAKGYGIPAEWMLDECGLLEESSGESLRNPA